ncbi:MAG: hypothetical protein ABSD75_06505 [Terriglobales bacterium]
MDDERETGGERGIRRLAGGVLPELTIGKREISPVDLPASRARAAIHEKQ